MAVTPDRTPGEFSAPPSDAPRQVTDGVPTTIGYRGPDGQLISAVDLARANEQSLKPLPWENSADAGGAADTQTQQTATQQTATTPRPSIITTEVVAAKPSVDPSLPAGTIVDSSGRPVISSIKPVDHPVSKRFRRVSGAPRPAIDTPGTDAVAADVVAADTQQAESSTPSLAAAAAALHAADRDNRDPTQPYQPAASDTDSPSRGIPQEITDPGRKITGGFGDVGEAQYFPLDGLELRALIEALLDDLHARIQDDLRFSIAMCYPRVRARVEIIVESYAQDVNFVIPRVMVPWEKTPIDVARSHADEIVFVVRSQRQEFDEVGEAQSAPNAIRMELDLPVPRKRAIETPGGRMLVDQITDMGGRSDRSRR